MDNLILDLLSRVSWHILTVSDLPFILCQLSMWYPQVCRDTQTLWSLIYLPSVEILWKATLGKKTKFPFYCLAFVVFCFASIRRRNNVGVLDLRISNVSTEADLLPIRHWHFGPKCVSLQQFPSLPLLCTGSCITPAFSWLPDSDEFFLDSPEEHRVLHKENYMGCYWICPYHYCKSWTQIG